MKIFNRVLSVAVATLVLASCTSDVVDNSRPQLQPEGEVGFMLPVEEQSRTALAEDGCTVNWVVGDRLSLWATNADGEYVVQNAPFQLRHFSSTYTKAFFSGNIAPLAEGEYTYMLCSPQPASVNGTEVTYSLPAVQSGHYDGRYDVMVATPVTTDAITSHQQVELNTTMHHQMHALKITIPEGRNLFGKPFSRLEIEFPTPVVGDMTFDVSNPDAEPTYSNLSNKIMIESAEPLDAGDSIWVFVLPGMVEGDVNYMVRTSNQKSEIGSYAVSRDMKRGRVTPISMAIPEIFKYTSLNFSLGVNNLGEDFNSFTIYDINGGQLCSFARNDQNLYTIGYEGDIDLSQYNNANLRIAFDTPNANVESTVNMGSLLKFADNYIVFSMPYLFEENFSTIPSFSDGHDDPATGWKSDTYNSANLLDTYTSVLAGWSGGRIGGSAGCSLRICCRLEGGLSATAYYKGRVDTAPMTKLKSGANVKLEVSFDYGAARKEYGTGSGANTTLSFGHTTSSGVIEPSSDITNLAITNEAVDDTSGSYTNMPLSRTVILNGCTNATRLSWQSSTTRASVLAGNGNYWIYLDNIKVKIAQ